MRTILIIILAAILAGVAGAYTLHLFQDATAAFAPKSDPLAWVPGSDQETQYDA